MNATDWIIDLVLIGLVVIQIRGRRLSPVQVLLPIVIVGWAIVTYVHEIPTNGNSLVLIAIAIAVGALIGIGVGLLTNLRVDSGRVIAQAGLWAAVLWVVGMGSRLVFQLFATNGGGESIGRFSVTHEIDPTAWAPALILMAAATILLRTVLLLTRAARLRQASASSNTPTARA